MQISLKRLWFLIKQSVNRWTEDGASSMGAALAYYTMFSLAPLLLIVISIAGLIFGEEAARGALFRQLASLVGDNGAQAIQAMLTSARDPGGAIFSTVVSVATLLLGATTVFAELQSDLD